MALIRVSTGPLVLAHDLDEPFFKRFPARANRVDPRLTPDQPADNLGQHLIAADSHSDDIASRHDAASKAPQAGHETLVDRCHAHFNLNACCGILQREAVHNASSLDERHAVAGGLHLSEQMRIEEDRGAALPKLADDV